MRLTPEVLLAAYAQGVFPMAHDDGRIYWHSPNPRAILPLDNLHVSRSLSRLLHQGKYEIRFDSDFPAVIAACAAPGPGREQTWISGEIIRAYTHLHELGFAHSVECRVGAELVGGLYGVSLRGLFAGESMFSRRPDASKAALYHLVRRLRERGFQLLDVQYLTPHLERLGAIEVSQWQYRQMLRRALAVDAHFD
jgi:leucyl/phenylalanyl-tRNA--protein transferase